MKTSINCSLPASPAKTALKDCFKRFYDEFWMKIFHNPLYVKGFEKFHTIQFKYL